MNESHVRFILSPDVVINNYHGFSEIIEKRENRQIIDFIVYLAKAFAEGANFRKTVLAGATKFPVASEFMDLNPMTLESTFGLKKRYLFPREKTKIKFSIINKKNGKALEVLFSGPSLIAFKKFIELAYQGAPLQKLRLAARKFASVFQYMQSEGFFLEIPKEAPIFADGKVGVRRLQHSTLLFQSKKTRILVDPVFHSFYDLDTIANPVLPYNLGNKIDAILISHSHEDHFHIPTLLGFPKNTLIIVPKTKRASLLSRDCEKALKNIGFTNVKSYEWYTKNISIGDFSVAILPFYGEQVTLSEQPRYRDFWMYGNTYHLKHKAFSSWLLVDSGSDARGHMREAAQFVRSHFGPLDLLLSNLRIFTIGSPQYMTGGSYWLTLSPEQMLRFHKMNRLSATLLPNEVAEIASIVGARNFSPYAHLWGVPGEPLAGKAENENLNRVAQELKKIKSKTKIVAWNIGDFFDFDSKKILKFKNSAAKHKVDS